MRKPTPRPALVPKRYKVQIKTAGTEEQNPFKAPAKPYKSPRARMGLNRTGGTPGDRMNYIKLSVAIGILAAVMLIRVFDPLGAEDMRGAVDAYIGGDKSAVTIEALGSAISEGGSITEVFSNLSDVFAGRWKVTPVDNPGDPDGVQGQDQDEGEISENLREPPQFMENTAARLFAVTASPLALSEDEVAFGAHGFDDTPPVPFGLAVPGDADYNVYELPFAYTAPSAGELSSEFGYRMHPIKGEILFHYGVDLSAPTGGDILSFADGKVTAVGLSQTYGNYLAVTHSGGISTFYAHCSKILVKTGDAVSRGQAVAKVGSTGLSTGPHLHFELRRDGLALDPARYLDI